MNEKYCKHEKIEWTKLDSIIDKAARDCVNSEDDILGQLGISHNYYGERIGMFKSGVEWALKHYRMLGFKKNKKKAVRN